MATSLSIQNRTNLIQIDFNDLVVLAAFIWHQKIGVFISQSSDLWEQTRRVGSSNEQSLKCQGTNFVITSFKRCTDTSAEISAHTCTSSLLQVGPHAVVVGEHGGRGPDFCSHVANSGHSCTHRHALVRASLSATVVSSCFVQFVLM